MAEGIPCFTGIKLKMGDKTLEDIFNEKAKGLSPSEQRKVGTEIALEYHKQLHTELNAFKKGIGIKDLKPYEAPKVDEEKIKSINDAYEKNIEELTKPIEPIEAEEKPQPEKPTDKTGDGAGNPPGGEGKEEKVGDGGDPELTKIANAVNDEFIKGNFGTDALDGIISQLQDTDLSKTYDAIKEKVKKGIIDPKVVRERVTTNKSGSAADQAVLLYDLADLKGKDKAIRKEIIASKDPKEIEALQRQLTDIQNQMMDNALANRFIGRDWHNIGKIRQQWINKDFNIVDMEQEYMASKGISELTPEQKAEIKKAHDTIKDLEVQRDAAKEELDKAVAENERLKAENELLKKLKGKAPRVKRTEEQLDASNKRIQKAKDELKGMRGQMNDATRVLPKTAFLIGKIAAEKVYQGAIEFRELVRDILEDVKEIFPDWKEKDVAAHLLNETGNFEKYYEAGKKYDTNNKDLRDKIKAYNKLQKEYALKMFEWQRDRRSDIMKKRPFKERAISGVLAWQRFAILSYPTTLVKLAAVVGHQLVLKPLKFAIQKFITAPISRGLGIADKQTIWADPTWRSLGKYYSAFVRNFSLANLKEQFGGIDTKEILYGDSFMYDEWAAAKGFLEMPGRSHGYIKSFIKNPEFQFAQENIATQHISKMAEIEAKLKDDKITDEEKDKLKEDYDGWDITNPDVMEKINKISLEHGKWAILMNDNKFTKKFQEWTRNNGFSGALAKSELPIVKIPLNFIYRAFATKYGLIRAITGKGRWESTENHFPGLVEMVFKGTKDMTPKQADIFGRCISLGSMGATFFVMGYLMSKHIKEEEDGSYTIFGKNISKLLVHSPELESIFSGATTKHEFDKKGGKGTDNWIKSFVESDIDIAKKSPFVSMLKYGFTANLATALLSTDNKDKVWGKVTDAVAKKISDMIVPGAVKQSASAMDVKGKNFDIFSKPEKRWPQGTDLERFWQTFEMGIPGLRQNVPQSQSQGNTITKEDAEKYPVFKDFSEKGVSMPDFDPKQIQTKEVNGKVVERLSDYPKNIQEKYLKAKKEALVEELQKLKSGEYEVLRDSDGTVHINSESLEGAGDMIYIPFDKLSKEDIQYLLGSNLSKKITEKAKQAISLNK